MTKKEKPNKAPERKKVMMSGVRTKLRCEVCNDTVSTYINFVDNSIDSWFCNDYKCTKGFYTRTIGSDRPSWVIDGAKQNEDLRAK